MRKPLIALLALGTTLTSPAAATVQSGHISQVFLSAPTNYGFRVFLDSNLSACGGSFAYENSDFGNYQAYVSALMTAYSLNKVVDMTYQIDTSGYCQIMEFLVH